MQTTTPLPARVLIDGRQHWRFDDGTTFPVISGGDGDEGDPVYFDLEGNEVDLNNLTDGAEVFDADGNLVDLTGDDGGDDGEDEPGWPSGTPVSKMTAEQQAAYWKDKARKHEGEAKRLRDQRGKNKGGQRRRSGEPREKPVAAGDGKGDDDEKTPEQIRAEAREEARREASGNVALDMIFNRLTALGVDDDRAESIVDGLNPSKYIDAEGDVDTDKVNAFIKGIAPSKPARGRNGNGRVPDLGQGRRSGAGGAKPSPGSRKGGSVEAGAELYRERHPAKK